MTSKATIYDEAFVWIWLPGETQPVVAGRVTPDRDVLQFNYGLSYLARHNAMSIFDELPLRAGILPLLPGLTMPGCLRDAAPDAWGRRVIINKKYGLKNNAAALIELSELTYLLESGSDRIGALDFQRSSSTYEPRSASSASLDELLESADRVDRGWPLTPELALAISHGTSIGGARPKAMIEDGVNKYIAKFSASSDLYSVVKAEFIAMRTAQLAGLNVAPVKLAQACNKDVLLIQRFDRISSGHHWQRKSMVSALTLLGLDELMARYASYEDLTHIIRARFVDAAATLKELFGRIVFNILSGNTDDHARNHAAFWNGDMLELTPAYDICPQGRAGYEASQAMLISGNDRASQLESCLRASHLFLLSRKEAIALMELQITTIAQQWSLVCDEAGLSQIDRNFFWGRQFLNPYAFYGLAEDGLHLEKMAEDYRNS